MLAALVLQKELFVVLVDFRESLSRLTTLQLIGQLRDLLTEHPNLLVLMVMTGGLTVIPGILPTTDDHRFVGGKLSPSQLFHQPGLLELQITSLTLQLLIQSVLPNTPLFEFRHFPTELFDDRLLLS